MISSRATTYLSTLPRRLALRDRAALEAAFHEADVSPLEPIIDFQMTFGGYTEQYGLNTFVWGIIHDQPGPDSAFERNRLSVERDDEEPGSYFVTCADCHMSDHWFLDSRGALYWCFAPPLASSFAVKIERDAVAWELSQRSIRRLQPSVPEAEFAAVLVPLIQEGRIEEASDQYESLYLHRGVYAVVKGNRVKAFVIDNPETSLLAGLPAVIGT